MQARLDRLLDAGMILDFTVRVQEPGGVDALRAVMMIEVAGRSTSAIFRRLRSFPEIRALHTTNGGRDLVAEIVAEGLQGFDRVPARDPHHRRNPRQRDQHPLSSA